MRYLFQEKGVRGRKLLEAFPMYSKATIYRHAKLAINETASLDRRGQNKGRPRKLTDRDERNLVRKLRKCRSSIRWIILCTPASNRRSHKSRCFTMDHTKRS